MLPLSFIFSLSLSLSPFPYSLLPSISLPSFSIYSPLLPYTLLIINIDIWCLSTPFFFCRSSVLQNEWHPICVSPWASLLSPFLSFLPSLFTSLPFYLSLTLFTYIPFFNLFINQYWYRAACSLLLSQYLSLSIAVPSERFRRSICMSLPITLTFPF